MSVTMNTVDPLELKPHIVVMGVGGGGGNAIESMITSGVDGVTFCTANTDAQALKHSSANSRLQLGINSTSGLGAGSNPLVGKEAAEESRQQIEEALRGNHMLFIAAGMGGGTGTGASPIVASIAKELGLLVVGVVTMPFAFEGERRMRAAQKGLDELAQHADTLITVENQNLFLVSNENTTLADAFNRSNRVLLSGVRSVTDLIIRPGIINLDFADIRTIMKDMGKAIMGTGEAEGEDRAISAAEAAMYDPIFGRNISVSGAKGVLISISGDRNMTLFEVDAAANRVKQEVDPSANIIFGSTFNEELNGKIRVSVIATGIDMADNAEALQTAAIKADTTVTAATTATTRAKEETLYNIKHSTHVKYNTVEATVSVPLQMQLDPNRQFFVPPKAQETEDFGMTRFTPIQNQMSEAILGKNDQSTVHVLLNEPKAGLNKMMDGESSRGTFGDVASNNTATKGTFIDIPTFWRKKSAK